MTEVERPSLRKSWRFSPSVMRKLAAMRTIANRCPNSARWAEAFRIGDWFRVGMEAVMLSPAAVNQQKSINGYQDTEHANAVDITGAAFSTHVDLGIVKNDFELGSGPVFGILETIA